MILLSIVVAYFYHPYVIGVTENTEEAYDSDGWHTYRKDSSSGEEPKTAAGETN